MSGQHYAVGRLCCRSMSAKSVVSIGVTLHTPLPYCCHSLGKVFSTCIFHAPLLLPFFHVQTAMNLPMFFGGCVYVNLQ